MDYFIVDGKSFRHGTANGYVNGKCRCFQCRLQNANRQAERHRKMIYGTYQPYFVDAAPARNHLRKLIESGLEIKTLARKLDVGQTTLRDLLYGRSKSRQKDRPEHKKQIARSVSEKILGVSFQEIETYSRFVDGNKVRRRVQALAAIGYNYSFIAKEIGVERHNFYVTLNSTRVHWLTFEAVDRVFKQYENTKRVSDDPRIQGGITRTLRTAKANGWLPPAAYDDIDEEPIVVQESTEPDHAKLQLLIARIPVELTFHERMWARNELLELSWLPKQIDELLQLKPGSTATYLRRIQRKDL